MSLILNLFSRGISQAQSHIQNEITPFTLLLKIFILGITCLLTPSALAKPIQSETLSSETPGTRATKVTSKPLADFSSANEPQTTPWQSNRWHFLFQPAIYLPVTIYGDTTVGEFTGDIAIDTDQITTAIKDNLNFAFFANLEAWTPNYHLVLVG